MAKYAMYEVGGKFSHGIADNILIPILFFVPFFLFTLSAYILLLATSDNKRVELVRFILSILLMIAAIRVVYFVYNTMADLLWADYFDGLNSGYYLRKALDFRLEFFIAFVVNGLVLLYSIDKKIQPWLSHISKK